MSTLTTTEARAEGRPERATLDRNLERIGWALFLIMIAALTLLPDGWVPTGTWLVGAGVIMVALNVVRHFNGIRVSGFTTALGVIALAVGLFAVAGVDLPVFPILLVAIGLQILYPAFVTREGAR
jgi:hypothetical protein